MTEVIDPGDDVLAPVVQPERSESVAAEEGMRVILRRIPGLTSPGLLQVPFLFQVPPLEQFEEQYAFNHNDYMTAFGGERSRPGGRQLATVQFETMFLDDLPSWSLIQDFVPHPILIKRELKLIHDRGTPFQLVAHQMPLWGFYDVNMPATLRSLTPVQKAGESDAIYFSMQFREYRDTRITVKRRKSSGGRRSSTRGTQPRTVVVQRLPDTSATLYDLAQRFLGGPSDWRKISAVLSNGVTEVAPDTDLRDVFEKYPQKKLTIPGIPAVLTTDEDDVDFSFV